MDGPSNLHTVPARAQHRQRLAETSIVVLTELRVQFFTKCALLTGGDKSFEDTYCTKCASMRITHLFRTWFKKILNISNKNILIFLKLCIQFLEQMELKNPQLLYVSRTLPLNPGDTVIAQNLDYSITEKDDTISTFVPFYPSASYR